MTQESYVAFLSVGLQLLPVLWILLLVETAFLRSAFSGPATADNRADRMALRIGLIPLGVLAEMVGVAGLAFNNRVVLAAGSYLMSFALVVSLTVTGIVLNRLLQPPARPASGSKAPPPST